jgi:hypothetical protein
MKVALGALACITLVGALAAAGYAMGSSSAPGSSEAKAARRDAFRDDYTRSLRAAKSQARRRGVKAGISRGHSEGERAGLLAGNRAGKAEADQQVAAQTPTTVSCMAPGVGEGGATVTFTVTGLSCTSGEQILKDAIVGCGYSGARTCQEDGLSCTVVSAGPVQPGSTVNCESGEEVVSFALPG